MKRLTAYIRGHWRLVGGLTAGLISVWLLLLFRLGSITGSLSSQERASTAFAGAWQHWLHDPLNLPLSVTQWLFLTVFPHHGHTTVRLPSTIIGFIGLLAFTYILRRWYGLRTAIFGTVIFATSAWYLHVSRYAGNEVVYLGAIPVMLATQIAWERHRDRTLTHYAAIGISLLLLYIPGMIWLTAVSLGLQSSVLKAAWKRLASTWQRVGLVFGSLVMLTPLILAFVKRPALIATWLGLPAHFDSASAVPHRLVHSVSFFIWHGPVWPQLWLDRLSILSIFTSAMLLLGLYFYGRHLGATRTRLLAGLFVVDALFYAVGGVIGFSLLVPLVYLVVAGGIGYLLHEWLRVFPRNPVARGVGYGLITGIVLLNCVYNIRSYFVAWPHSSATVQAFRDRP